MNVNEMTTMDKGNMSALERKIDVLLRLLVAQTETERNVCYGEAKRLQLATDAVELPAGMQARIDEVLRDLGVPDHLRGYDYLRMAVELTLQDPDAVHCITGVIYPQVAECFRALPASVERAIRHAIEIGWMRCELTAQEKYFGNQIDPVRSKPTNAQFIAKVANVVRSSIYRLQN